MLRPMMMIRMPAIVASGPEKARISGPMTLALAPRAGGEHGGKAERE